MATLSFVDSYSTQNHSQRAHGQEIRFQQYFWPIAALGFSTVQIFACGNQWKLLGALGIYLYMIKCYHVSRKGT